MGGESSGTAMQTFDAAPGSADAGEPQRKLALARPLGATVLGWEPTPDLSVHDWIVAGQRFGKLARCSQWLVGDWIRYGETRWGEKYAFAAKITGYDPATLRNIAYVASRFDLSIRNDKLTFSHHALLAGLQEEDARRHWLARAEKDRLSVADLRAELRMRRRKDEHPGTSEEVLTHEGDASSSNPVCPHCGRALGPRFVGPSADAGAG